MLTGTTEVKVKVAVMKEGFTDAQCERCEKSQSSTAKCKMSQSLSSQLRMESMNAGKFLLLT